MDIFDIDGERIRALRDGLGWTREKLSELSGVPYRTLQDLETGRVANPGIYTIQALLTAMRPYCDELAPHNETRAELVATIVLALPNVDGDDLKSIADLAVAASGKSTISKAD